jgi:NADPH2:quinone reductase
MFFLGSDDFPAAAKVAAAGALNEALQGEWPGFEIDPPFPLGSIAKAHEEVEERSAVGRVVVNFEDH